MTEQEASDLLEREHADVSEQLEAIRSELDATRQSTSAGTGDSDQFSDDTGLMVEQERLESLLASAEAHLEEVGAAQERVVAGTYGTCERCGKTITKERLKALPSTRYCVGCATVVQRAAS